MRAAPLLATAALAATPTSTVLSTSYCQAGTTASGEHTRAGIVATRLPIPFGTVVAVLSRPLPFGRRRWIVEDRMAPGDAAELDWFSSSCTAALRWGSRAVRVRFTYPHRRPNGH